MATMYVNFGNFANWANKIANDNDKLLEQLNNISARIDALGGTYQSDASTAIREKIVGMKPRFEQYHHVIDSYVKFIRATGDTYKATEQVNTNKANDFI